MTLILHLSIGVGEKETAAKNPSLHMDNVKLNFLNLVLQKHPLKLCMMFQPLVCSLGVIFNVYTNFSNHLTTLMLI